jgi:branched-chain amino acid transport system permease protein
MIPFEEILIFGGIQSMIYALLALGFTLIYGIAGILNLAHGSFYMLGAYMFFVFNSGLQFFMRESGLISDFAGLGGILTSVLALILAVVFIAVVAGFLYRITIHPVLGDEIAVMVVTVCLALVLQQIILALTSVRAFGPTSRPPVGWPIGSILTKSIIIWGVTVQYSRILSFVVSVVLFGVLLVFVARTKIGKAMRAVSQDREVAMLMGINTNRLYILTMALSAMFAAVASILITTSTTGFASAAMWLPPLALSFSIVILGGLGSIKGSIIGGFIIGYAGEIVARAVPEGGAIVVVVPLAVCLEST